jgi:hypothetical protein
MHYTLDGASGFQNLDHFKDCNLSRRLMKSILKSLKLIDYLITEIPMERKDFVEKLKMNVDQGGTGFFLSAFEAFSSSKKNYKGTVGFDSFRIRRRRRFFDTSMNLAVAEGSFRQKENLLVIQSTINGFHPFFIPFTALLLIIYIVAIVSVIFSDNLGNMGWFFVPFFFIHSLLMLGIPYYMMRKGVSRMMYELDRDFYYMTK